MRIFFLMIYLIGCLLVGVTPAQAQELYPMRNYNKWGYINSQGKWMIPPTFDMALHFSDGVALVKDTYKGSEVWDVIDEKGQKIIQSEYFGYGVFLKLFDYRVTIQPNNRFTEGLVPVTVEILDKNYRGPAVSGFLNKSGELELYGYYDKVFNFNEGLACVVKNGKYGFINHNGEWVIKPVFAMCGSFSNGLAPALDEKTRKWGYINNKGAWVIEPEFSKAKDFSEGLAAVWKDFKWGFINENGKYVIPLEYRTAESFNSGYAYVGKENSFYFINQQGQKAFSDELYSKICFTTPFIKDAALMAVAPDGNKCFNFELAENVILQDSNLLLYLTPNGKIMYKQEMDEYISVNKISQP